MWPKWHLLYSFIFVYVIVYFFQFSIFAGAVIFLSSIFIDIDHILFYSIKERNFNLFKFWSWSKINQDKYKKLSKFERDKLKKPYFIFHSIEFIIILIIFSFFNKIFLWILAGFLFHLVLDYIALIYEKEHFSIKFSQIWLWFRNKDK